MKIEWIEHTVTTKTLRARVGDYDIFAKEITEDGGSSYNWGTRNYKTNRHLDDGHAKSLADAKRKATAAVEKRIEP